MSKRVLIIGLDGGSWTILKPAIEQGYMPFLKSLIDSGCSGILESTIPAITPAAWGTFQTGRNPGANGVYSFSYWDRTTKKFTLVNSTNLKQTIWQMLAKAGKRTVALNVPMTYPPQPVNGYTISGILTPSTQSNFTYPPEFKTELLEKYPDYEILNFKKIKNLYPGDAKIKAFLDTLKQVVDIHTETACHLLKKEDWDVFMVHFQETDILQHMLWKFLDPSHPKYDHSQHRFIISNFFQYLDSQIQTIDTLFKQSNPASVTMVVSDHGFESHYRRFNLGNWLFENGYLNLKQTVFKNFRTKQWIDQFCNRLGELQLNKAKVELQKLAFPIHDLIDWSRTSTFSVASGGEGFIYLLEDDPTRKQTLVRKLSEKLLEIKDPMNDFPITKKVHLNEELYSGDKTHLLPDLIIEPSDGYSFTGLYQPGGELFNSVNHKDTIQIGKHHKDGIIIAAGPHIRPSDKLHLRLVDIAPTLLYYMQVPPPASLDGNICYDLFDNDFTETTPVLEPVDETPSPAAQSTDSYSSKEQDLIKKRLKDLGYL